MINILNRRRILTSGVTPSINLKTNLISCWEFNETSGVISNDAHSTNNGTIVGATINQTGKLDKAYSYDGVGDYINYGNVINLERTGSFSISNWSKRSTLIANATILSKMEGSNNFRGYMLRLNNGYPTVTLRNDNSPSNFTDVSFQSVLPLNVWNHTLITYNGNSNSSGIKCYVNNVEITSKVISGDTLTGTILNNEPLNIGTLNNGSFYDMNGLIDQTAIWNKILTVSEISELYNSGVGLAYSVW